MNTTCRAAAILLGFSAALFSNSSSFANDDVLTFSDDVRCWQDASGNHQIDATLTKYHKRRVTLEGPNGKAIELSIDKLSKSDQAYLIGKLRAARKRNAKKLDDSSQRSARNRQFVSVRKPNKTTGSIQAAPAVGLPQKMYNVDWHPPQSASRLAMAQRKPIMWFRVLGDLSGFM